MALEQHGQRHYYYSKRRIAGKVRSIYGGSGPLAEVMALAAQVKRQSRELERSEYQRFVETQRRTDVEIARWQRQVHAVVNDVLIALGFHQHKRQWRLRRGKMVDSTSLTTGSTSLSQVDDAQLDEVEAYYRLLQQARSTKNAAALKRLEAQAQAHPEIFEMQQMQLSYSITLGSAIRVLGLPEAMQQHMRQEAEALDRRLAQAGDSPLERLLIQSVVLAWVRYHGVEQLYTSNFTARIQMGDYLERRLSATQDRYLKALESLARVRKLLAHPSLQLNIAQQQVVVNR